jgi:hypothetical protein
MNISKMRNCLDRGMSVAAFVAVVGLSSVVEAGPVESLASLAQHPSDDQVLVLRYENGEGGLLFSRDRGASFQIHPSASFTQYGLRGTIPLALTSSGVLLIGLSEGLAADDGQGCGVEVDATITSWVTDMARHPSDAGITFVLTTGMMNGARTGLWKRDAAGTIGALQGNDTGTQMGTPDYQMPIFVAKSLRVVARAQSGEGLRFVEVGNKVANNADRTMTVRTPTLRYSDDLGATWTEHTIVSATANDDTRLVAVTADEPMKVVLAVLKTGAVDPPDAVLLSTDGGEHFAPYIDGITSVGQALITPDGRFFLADTGPANGCTPSGLWSAPEVGAAAERITDYPVHCLGYEAAKNALYVCKAYELGLLYPSERAYCRLFTMAETTGFVSCSGADDLAASDRVDMQLCSGWCGPTHFAASASCDEMSCVAEARAYDLTAGWITPPGQSAPSCTGFEPSDAGGTGGGVPGCGSDAGADAGETSDASVSPIPDAGPSNDASAAPGRDASAAPGRDGSTSPTDPGEGEEPGGDGCDCSVRRDKPAVPDLAGLGVMLWLLGRSRRFGSRQSRPSADA